MNNKVTPYSKVNILQGNTETNKIRKLPTGGT